MPEETISTLNSLLRGELAAEETYQQALDKVNGGIGGTQLKKIFAEHCQAASLLRQQVRNLGGEPAVSSGIWGTFAQTIEGAAKLLGNAAALEALREGEQSGISSYESALREEGLPGECRSLISTTLLPQTRLHVEMLESLIKVQ